jgi:hypothetical protein
MVRRRYDPSCGPARRRGVILLVVLMLLTLMAIIGLAFVFYASSAATSARMARDSESLGGPDVEPELLLAYFLGQLLYDVDDDAGLGSALRGHSLARLTYGWNADDPDGNATPFNGTGRLHEPGPFTVAGGTKLDGQRMVNYTAFRNAHGSLADGFVRDPERLGWRTSPGQPPGPYAGGFNAAYTYPDLNNLFLAAVRADGTVLLPSFHRPWTGFGPLTPDNPNWFDTTKPWLKYLVLRPRPADMGPGFPAPENGGDVKNLPGTPGGNDSVWLDLDFPVLTAADGRKYKPLFAPLIVDLDNRVNVNVHGNVRGAGNAHRSNQGWGPWEVNLGRVLPRGDEWTNLLLGGGPSRPGRYGPDGKPGPAGAQAAFGPRPHAYAQVDFDASNEGTGGLATEGLRLPGSGAPALSCFPVFPPGYGNGSGGRPGTEGWEHPVLSDPFRRTGDDRAFAAHNLEALLRHGDTGSPGLASDLVSLCPVNFRDPRARRLVTTHSWDLDRPGAPPWLFDRDASGYQSPLGGAGRPPTGPPVPFPNLSLRLTSAVPPHSDFRTPGASPTDPSADWRAVVAGLGRLDLNSFLPPYPHQGRGLSPATADSKPLAGYATRFDSAGADAWKQFLAAQSARQGLADDIYRLLLAVTGVPAPQDPLRPTNAELAPRRWLAQLAVNVVDFIDEDEISTPFNFYTARDAGDPGFDAGALGAGNPELPRYWVFGTELPRVVVNEVLTEYALPARREPGTFPVRVWVELFNPLPGGTPAGAQPLDSLPVPLYVTARGGGRGFSPYRVVIANTNPGAGGPLLPRSGAGDNVLGTPDVTQSSTDDSDFARPATTVAGTTLSTGPGLAPQGFLLLGPPGADANGTIAPPAVPGDTPLLKSANLQYLVRYTPPDTWSPDYRVSGVSVLLRRLANPYLPPDPRPVVGGAANPAYNPFVTADFLSGIPLNDATSPRSVHASRGKPQPYAADPSQVAAQVASPRLATQHTLGRPNVPVPPAGHYDWLVHLDRRPVSPMELLQVSGHPPYRLTRTFISPDRPGGPVKAFNHRVPWFDQGTRLYRLFEFLSTDRRGTGPGGRRAGKVNLNTVWDPETLLALCDPQPGNGFTAADVFNPDRPDDPGTVWGRLLASRTPGGRPGPDDRPFRSLAVGYSPRPGDALYPAGGDAVNPAGSGIDDTLLRAAVAGGGADAPRLFEVPGPSHPYLKDELLTKLFNNVTTRSNVFGVWLTVGFFEVTDERTVPVKLGAELGRVEGRHRRHRMFAVVDRTSLTRFATRSTTAVTVPPSGEGVRAAVTPASMSGVGANGRPWRIREGAVLTVDSGEAEEEVVVTAVTPTSFTATFTKPHAAGFAVLGRGNPGPQVRFNPPEHPEVVLYYAVIY